METNYCVYKHTNKTNGKVYIGITGRKPEERWDYGWGYCRQPVFWNAIEKYGWDGFTHEILFEGLTKDEAIEKEIELIAAYKSNVKRYYNPSYGYNADDGGTTRSSIGCSVGQYDLNGNLIKVWESVKQASLDLNIDYQTIFLCLNNKGYRAGEYMWQRSEDGNFPQTIENYAKRRGLKSAQPKTEYVWVKAVAQYDLNGNLLNTFSSLLEAKKATGITDAQISACCCGRNMTAGGFIWRHIEGEPAKKIEIKTLNRCLKAVLQYDLDGNYLQTWESVSEASRALKINASHISGACRGNRKTCGGFKWRYSE